MGGYASAKLTCSPQMECGKKGSGTTNAYGSSGNDCPKNFMCYTDIDCYAPTNPPSGMPSERPSMSHKPTTALSGMPSVNPTMSNMPTPKGQTKNPSMQPTISPKPTESPTKKKAPTVPPYNLQNSITTRGSYCGTSFQAAVDACSPVTSCGGNDDCDGEEGCWPNISCTFHASEADENYLGGSTPTGLDGNGDNVEGEEERDNTGSSDGFGFEFDGNKLGDEYANSSEVKMFGWAGTSMVAVSVLCLGTMLV